MQTPTGPAAALLACTGGEWITAAGSALTRYVWSLYCRSADGISWALSPVNAFCRNVSLTNGSVAELARRERPKLIFDASGAPTHLVSSAAWGGAAANGDATFTFIQPLHVAGGDL